MYIENVRQALGELSFSKRQELAMQAKSILVRQRKIKDSVRPAEIEGYLKNFIDGKDTSLKYLDGFLEALDSLYMNGARHALFDGRLRHTRTWREIFINLTRDIPSPTLTKHMDNPDIMTGLKSLFIRVTEACVSDDPDVTTQRLRVLNDLFKNRR